MALSIKDPEADRLARELAARTGESLTGVVVNSLRERLDRLNRVQNSESLLAELGAIRHRMAALPLADERTADEIIGYDREGLAT